MASFSSLPADRRQASNFNSNNSTRKANGRFWSRSGLGGQSPEHSGFSFRSIFAPSPSSTNMSTTKELPQPATNNPGGLSPHPDYAEKVFRRFHQHNLSDSTATSGSNDSSPTTTCSTVDDSSATEPSPGSSPESPPPSSFAMLRPRTSDDNTSPFFELQRAAPPKKGRNLKGLAVNTTRTPGKAQSMTSLPLAKQAEPEQNVMSPSFVKPPTPPKRKPSNLGLTILTPSSTSPAPQAMKLSIPPTPGFGGRPATLRHFQSSPSLPLFPNLGAEIGAPTKLSQTTTLETIVSPTEPPQIRAKVDDEQNFDIPLSQEEKPEAYPDGPICVYEPAIDLYLEPTAEQARNYDVVMNVASEVRNPFVKPDEEPKSPEPDLRIDGGGGIQYAPKREKLGGQLSVELEQNQPSTPSTPKATPMHASFPEAVSGSDSRDPEYIHIPWEHNSDIVPDLLGLVKLMDERVAQKKKVLVHCQCGVSRSASLVVAYGLYKDPSMSVQEAYDMVKQRSKWIGPNMNLIMQLQEFRTSLARGGLLPGNRGLSPLTPGSTLSEWPGPFSSRSIDGAHAGPLSAGITSAKTPGADSLPALSPGPSSAPSGLPWPKEEPEPPQRPRALTTMPQSSSTYVDPSGHVIPVLNVVEPEHTNNNNNNNETPPPATYSKPRSITVSAPSQPDNDEAPTPTSPTATPAASEFALTPLKPTPEADPADSFGLMSPTSTSFASSPFDRCTLLAQLGMGFMRPSDDEPPTRTRSLRLASRPEASSSNNNLTTPQGRKLRGKISSPSIREQRELQRLQAEMEAKLHIPAPTETPSEARTGPEPSQEALEESGLMSPRATEFTANPFALSLSLPPKSDSEDHSGEEVEGLSVDQRKGKGKGMESLLDLGGEEFKDPRSPAHKGVSPITRNIGDVL